MEAHAPVQHTDPALEHARASMLLRALAENAVHDDIRIGDMTQAFGERAFGILMIVFCLPNMIPTPGIGSLFGIPLLLIALQMMSGASKPWLPASIEAKTISRSTFARTVDVVEPRIKRLEAILKPRWTFLFSPLMDRVIGAFAVLCAVSIIIPFPGTNFLPAVALIMIALAVMQEDGLFLGLGVIIGMIGLTYTTVVVGGLAYAGVLMMLRWIGL